MEVFEAIRERRSVRAYLPQAIAAERLERILEAARLAPSASNRQPWHFVVVTNQQKRKALSKERYAKFLAESPVVIVGCGDRDLSPNWHVVDTAIAMQNMVLTATGEGLGTCWVGSFNENQVKELLSIPEKFKVVALLALGYPREKLDLRNKIRAFIRRRRKLEKIVSLNEFGNPANLQRTSEKNHRSTPRNSTGVPT
jgi:nitroreductase